MRPCALAGSRVDGTRTPYLGRAGLLAARKPPGVGFGHGRCAVSWLANYPIAMLASPSWEEGAMVDVKPLQVWDVRENDKAPWREAKVINMRRQEIELQFLDMPNAPHVARIFKVSRKRLLSERKTYRLVSEPK